MKIIYIMTSVIFSLMTLLYIKKRKLDFKLSLLWLAVGTLTIAISCLPQLIDISAKRMGVIYAPSILFLFGILFSFTLIFSLTIMVSDLKKKISRLSQEIAILKDKVV